MSKADLLKILRSFRRLKIPFALAGGYAVAAWGVVRATRDIDFLAAAPGNLAMKLVAELKKAGFNAVLRKGDESDPLLGLIHVELPNSPDTEPVDIVLGIRGMPSGLYSRTVKVLFMGFEIPVVAPEDLIVLKCIAAGPIDLKDARAIFAVSKERLDVNYLEKELQRRHLSIKKLENGDK